MTIAQWLLKAQHELKKAEVDSPRLDSLIILENVINEDRTWILAHDKTELDKPTQAILGGLVQKRCQRIPLAYLVGFKEFYGLRIDVIPSVLVPRPETESLVGEIISSAPINGKVLDLGTGSGAIAIALKYHRKDLDLTASDISTKAISVASANAQRLNTKINFVQSDLFSNIDQKFDVIAANLPYVPKDRDHQPEILAEPELALFADNNGLKLYELMFSDVRNHLSENGFVIIEHEPEQFDKICTLTEMKADKISDFVTKFI